MKGRGLLLAIVLILLPTISWKEVPKKEYTDIKSETTTKATTFEDYALTFYQNLNTTELAFDTFKIALRGFLHLQKEKQLTNSKYLTIVDFSKSSKNERLYIIDTETKEIIHKSLVAHGRNSGLEYAKKFSNRINSHQSSLGFYKTAETYTGKHGYSLRLDGLEFSNNNARKRAIVIHSADYASEKFVTKNSRLGRSYGCPSLPKKGYTTVISKIKEGSCLFIYYPQENYLNKSKLANASIDVSPSL